LNSSLPQIHLLWYITSNCLTVHAGWTCVMQYAGKTVKGNCALYLV